MTMAGSFDNFTRVSHQWGQEKAQRVWHFYHDAYSYTHKFAQQLKAFHKQGARLRITSVEDEKKEMQEACVQLKSHNFPVSFSDKPQGEYSFLGQKITAVQDESKTGGWIDQKILYEKLREQLKSKVTFISGKACSLKNDSSVVEVTLDGEQGVRAEAVVLCCHLGIKDLIPNFKSVLIPYQDQSHILSFDPVAGVEVPEGVSFSYFHGYLWGSFLETNLMQIGGARFLRKDAGIDADAAELSQKVQEHLLKEAPEIFSCVKAPIVKESYHGLEIKPCDELPVIGPMYGEPRVLMAAGFSGLGLTLGLYSGKILADILYGTDLGDQLQPFEPKRFRTL